MSWPTSQDYNEAIQSPTTSFADAELQAGEPAVNAIGLPLPRSGNFADVYEFLCPNTGERWALKCFTREVPGLKERYSAISDYLEAAALPFTVDFQYLAEGISIRGEWYPLLKMQWVEGFTLNEFVRDNVDKKSLLGNLEQIWLRMAKRLRTGGLAHGDLQHGNVLLVPGSSSSSLAVRLIDYDGMFVPKLAQWPSGEVGHPAYQHPQRSKTGAYSLEIDRFPLLTILTALHCLILGGRKLWERYDNGDNLLFREADLKAPEQSALFRELGTINDPIARGLVETLQRCCSLPMQMTPHIDELWERLHYEANRPILVELPEDEILAPMIQSPPPPPPPARTVAAFRSPPAPPKAPPPIPQEIDAAPRRQPRKKPRTRSKEPDMSVPWGVIRKAVGAGLVIVIIMAFFLSRRGKTIDKPVDRGDSSTVQNTTPVETPPDETPVTPPMPMVPVVEPLKRTPLGTVEGTWVVADDTLTVKESAKVFWGSTAWRDYDYEVEVRRNRPDVVLSFWLRADGMGNGLIFSADHPLRQEDWLQLKTEGEPRRMIAQEFSGRVQPDCWVKVKVTVRGNRVRCLVGGRDVYNQVIMGLSPTGAVGLTTEGPPGLIASFRNLKVTLADGKIAWDGLPELPTR